MAMKVEATTTTAAQLFSTSVFLIPDFQRDYSWGPDGEVKTFFNDLQGSLNSPPYFLGLLIVTDENERRVVVDGQQRLTTLTLLANAIRKQAVAMGKSLIADSMRDIFLFYLDYESETRFPRIQSTAERDRATLSFLLEGGERPVEPNKWLMEAQRELDIELAASLEGSDSDARLARWARFISNGLTFALFEHPTRNSAYKVYEVVNTRGRDLTPAELIKSYLISSVSQAEQRAVYGRWSALETAFVDLDAATQYTQFVRHIVTLSHGYVIPRDLYQVITEQYVGPEGVEELLTALEKHLRTYLQLVDPSIDNGVVDEAVGTSFAIPHALGLRTVRPIFVAVAGLSDPSLATRELVSIVVTRLTVGAFGTGSVERQFAEAARAISGGQDWQSTLADLREDLSPRVSAFETRLLEGTLPKGLLHVLRNSLIQETALPTLDGFVHQVRPKNAEDWPNFEDSEFRALGGTIGNAILLKTERRPRNTNTLSGALERLFPNALDGERELLPEDVQSGFGAAEVRSLNNRLASRAAAIWYP